jgi:translocation and assembly module TamB
VSAVGRVALRSLTGSIGVKADRLPILLRRDRWMVVSGEGGITLTTARADLYAKVQVDGAYIDFSGLRGPRTLPGDVVVVRAEQPRRAGTPPPIDVTLAVEGRLGRRVYIRGAGLEHQLAGQVAVTDAGALKATGTVRTLDGVWGYSQRLRTSAARDFQPAREPALTYGGNRRRSSRRCDRRTAEASSVCTGPGDVRCRTAEWLVLGRPPGGRATVSPGTRGFRRRARCREANDNEFERCDPGHRRDQLRPGGQHIGTPRADGRRCQAAPAASESAIGKRISDDLYLTFEQALSGAAYHVALSYQLTRRLSLIARTGSTNALDLVYSIAFD